MADFTSFLADMDQVAYVRSAELTEGDGRGCRIIDVFNGSGLAFTVAPDRGMNIVECSYRGIPVAFRTPSGHVAPGKFGPEEWLRNWEGGLLTSCGLRHAGPPEEGETLHGRISGASASQVGSRGAWRDGVYELTVSGVLREASMFGENLRLARTIRTAYRENSITVSDEVTNCSGAPDFLLMLYHCNFGWPLVSPSVRVEAEEHEIIPRTPEAAAGMERWREMPEPVVGAPEQVFFHCFPGAVSLVNRELGIRATVERGEGLPYLVQWKSFDPSRYVIGLEPANNRLEGRKTALEKGLARRIEPGETLRFQMKISFSDC